MRSSATLVCAFVKLLPVAANIDVSNLFAADLSAAAAPTHMFQVGVGLFGDNHIDAYKAMICYAQHIYQQQLLDPI